MTITYTHTRAEISACGQYRYTLSRRWLDAAAEPFRFVLWVGLNPSTADGREDDATIRRMRNFTHAWGFAEFVVCNLFAFRARDPDVMKAAADPIGPQNDETLRRNASAAAMVICCWGADGEHLGRGRRVRAMLPAEKLWILKLTKDGHPGHPLYLPGHLNAAPWR